jgi:hypothetical protein
MYSFSTQQSLFVNVKTLTLMMMMMNSYIDLGLAQSEHMPVTYLGQGEHSGESERPPPVSSYSLNFCVISSTSQQSQNNSRTREEAEGEP